MSPPIDPQKSVYYYIFRQEPIPKDDPTWGMLLVIARSRLPKQLRGDPHHAETVLQESLDYCHKRAQSQGSDRLEYRSSAELGAFIRTALGYKISDLNKKLLRHQHVPIEAEPEMSTDAPDANILAAELSAKLASFSETCKDRDRQVFHLYVLERRSSSEVAALLGISDANVKTIATRLRKLLADFLANSGFDVQRHSGDPT